MSQNVTIWRIKKCIKEKNLPVMIIFIIFFRVFDTIDGSKMFDILRAYGKTEKLSRQLQSRRPTLQPG